MASAAPAKGASHPRKGGKGKLPFRAELEVTYSSTNDQAVPNTSTADDNDADDEGSADIDTDDDDEDEEDEEDDDNVYELAEVFGAHHDGTEQFFFVREEGQTLEDAQDKADFSIDYDESTVWSEKHLRNNDGTYLDIVQDYIKKHAKDMTWTIGDIVDCRNSMRHGHEYRVQWAGFPNEFSWEPETRLEEDCPQLLEECRHKHGWLDDGEEEYTEGRKRKPTSRQTGSARNNLAQDKRQRTSALKPARRTPVAQIPIIDDQGDGDDEGETEKDVIQAAANNGNEHEEVEEAEEDGDGDGDSKASNVANNDNGDSHSLDDELLVLAEANDIPPSIFGADAFNTTRETSLLQMILDDENVRVEDAGVVTDPYDGATLFR